MEKFCLKWNDFQTTVSQSFGLFRREEDFFDVTLVSDDEVQISAHKLVLSACSTFFRSILTKNVHSNPLLYLSGVSSTNIGFILDYVYHGEVQIHQEQLDSFLDAAQMLRISGLTSDKNNQDEFESKPEQEQILINKYEDKEMELPIHSDDKMRRAVVHNAYKNVVATTHTLNTSDKSEINSKINELLETTDGLFVCKACGKSSRDRRNIGRHVETHIEGLSFPCQRCDKTFR